MNKKHILGGVIGGLVGGIVFGIPSQVTGMMPMIAMLVHSQSATVGWVVHLALSVVGGIVFVAVFGRLANSYSRGAGYGLLYGVIWWVFGMLIAMPLLLGMQTELSSAFDQMNIMSLYGHLAWGLLLGLAFVLYTKEDVAVAPKEIWKSTWPFVVITILLILGALPSAGSSMMQTGSNAMGGMKPDATGGMEAHPMNGEQNAMPMQ